MYGSSKSGRVTLNPILIIIKLQFHGTCLMLHVKKKKILLKIFIIISVLVLGNFTGLYMLLLGWESALVPSHALATLRLTLLTQIYSLMYPLPRKNKHFARSTPNTLKCSGTHK